jgi:hypothetical protein
MIMGTLFSCVHLLGIFHLKVLVFDIIVPAFKFCVINQCAAWTNSKDVFGQTPFCKFIHNEFPLAMSHWFIKQLPVKQNA